MIAAVRGAGQGLDPETDAEPHHLTNAAVAETTTGGRSYLSSPPPSIYKHKPTGAAILTLILTADRERLSYSVTMRHWIPVTR